MPFIKLNLHSIEKHRLCDIVPTQSGVIIFLMGEENLNANNENFIVRDRNVLQNRFSLKINKTLILKQI
jgi:hypothetical protein